ncbi:acyl transferase 15-like [Lolium perenne]|uniref:acyl transferase 15-like n=1 Tax=Lolium perenne TaxID=4522 RepID=UPI0021EB3B6D|nr:acyl transferase 15-like [Lolium perenne]
MAVVVISKSPPVLVMPSSDPATSATFDHFSLISLTSYDDPNVGRPVTAFLVFERPIDDPAETIRRGLSLALVPYYPISGRLVGAFVGDHVFTAIHCSNVGDAGVPFIAASADAALRDVDLRGHLQELAVFYPAEGDPLLRPLLLLQVTVFSCGGFVVGVTWDQAIADGAGMSQFLQAVGELARGMSSPTVVPFRHDLALAGMPLAIQRVDRLINSLQPSLLTLVHVSVPYSLVTRIKHEFAAVNNSQPCTVFEAVTAVLWRCRTRVVMQDPSSPALLGFVADTRRHAGAKHGFYGNCCFLAPPVVATSGAVAEGDINDVIKMIQHAKGRIPSLYSASSSSTTDYDEDGRRLQELADAGKLGYGNMLGVSCWRNLGMEKADFGGGTPARVMGYMKEGMGRLPSCVCLPSVDGDESFSVMALCVKKEHAAAFLIELATFN